VIIDTEYFKNNMELQDSVFPFDHKGITPLFMKMVAKHSPSSEIFEN
jgi:hypothetical protein